MRPLAVYSGNNLKRKAYLENAYNIKVEKKINSIWTASFSLPYSDKKREYIEPFDLIEIWDKDSYGNHIYVGLFRVLPITESPVGTNANVQYELEHVISTLLDDIMLGWHEIGNLGVYTSNVIAYILSNQTKKRWTLGECKFSHQYLYGWQDENLLSALYSVVNPFSETNYYWTYDTLQYPWTLNLEMVNPAPVIDIRNRKNIYGIQRISDPTNLTTRLYCYGSGEGDNKLSISKINNGVPYLESPNVGVYGVITQIWTDERYTSEASLKSAGEAMLKKLEAPVVTYEIDIKTFAETSSLSIGDTVRVVYQDFDELMVINGISHDNMSSKAGTGTILLGADAADITTSISGLAEKQRISETYAQGAESIFTDSFYDNADASNPAEITFTIPESAVHVNEISVTVSLKSFRAYSKATLGGGAASTTTASGGSTTVTSSGGGASTQTSTYAGSNTITSSAGGSSTQTSSSGGATTQTSSAGGSTQTTSGSAGESNQTSSAGGATTQTSSAGGSSTQTSSAGGSTQTSSGSAGESNQTSSSGGATSSTTNNGGNSTQTSSAGGSTQTSSGSAGESNQTSSAGGGTSTTTSSGGGSTATSSSGGGSSATSSSGGSTSTTTGGGGGTTREVSGGAVSGLETKLSSAIGDYTDGPDEEYTYNEIWSSKGANSEMMYEKENHVHKLMTHKHELNDHTHYFKTAKHDHTFSIPSHQHTITLNDHTHSVTISSHTHNVSIPSHTHDVNIPSHTHSFSLNTHTHTVTIPSHTHSVNIPSHTHSVNIPSHNHTFTINAHTHTVTIPSHTHSITIPSHTHSTTIPSHTHSTSIPNHTHTVTIPSHSHSVTIGTHTHTTTIPAHTHTTTIPSHTHNVTIPSHTHDVTIPSHTHSVSISAHTHNFTLPDHTHQIEYGIYKGPQASQMTLKLDNVIIGTTSSVTNLSLLDYMPKDSSGNVARGNHVISITPNSLTRIEGSFIIRLFTNSHGASQY